MSRLLRRFFHPTKSRYEYGPLTVRAVTLPVLASSMVSRDSSRFGPTLVASAIAASLTFPFWRASAIAQSGFAIPPALPPPSSFLPLSLSSNKTFALYQYALRPPLHGLLGVVFGMTWARCAIFWGSDRIKVNLLSSFPSAPVALVAVFPPLISSFAVQILNMPLIRASILLQNPAFVNSSVPNVTTTRAALRRIVSVSGFAGLFHGTSAGLLKTVPKYVVAIVVRDFIAARQRLPDRDDTDSSSSSSSSAPNDALISASIFKACVAGAAGGLITNPFDVLRNEMFSQQKKTLTLLQTVRALNEGDEAKRIKNPNRTWKDRWPLRGMGKNIISVVLPVAITIFATDMLEKVM